LTINIFLENLSGRLNVMYKPMTESEKLEYLKKRNDKNKLTISKFKVKLSVQEKKEIEFNIVKFNCPF